MARLTHSLQWCIWIILSILAYSNCDGTNSTRILSIVNQNNNFITILSQNHNHTDSLWFHFQTSEGIPMLRLNGTGAKNKTVNLKLFPLHLTEYNSTIALSQSDSHFSFDESMGNWSNITIKNGTLDKDDTYYELGSHLQMAANFTIHLQLFISTKTTMHGMYLFDQTGIVIATRIESFPFAYKNSSLFYHQMIQAMGSRNITREENLLKIDNFGLLMVNPTVWDESGAKNKLTLKLLDSDFADNPKRTGLELNNSTVAVSSNATKLSSFPINETDPKNNNNFIGRNFALDVPTVGHPNNLLILELLSLNLTALNEADQDSADSADIPENNGARNLLSGTHLLYLSLLLGLIINLI